MPTTRGHPRATERWKRVRKQVLAGVTHCTRCGLPFVFGVPRHRRSPSVDHIIPLALGGDPFALSNLRAVCYSCNSKGGWAVAARAARAAAAIYDQRPSTAHRGNRPPLFCDGPPSPTERVGSFSPRHGLGVLTWLRCRCLRLESGGSSNFPLPAVSSCFAG
jgi:HNH endonuclease